MELKQSCAGSSSSGRKKQLNGSFKCDARGRIGAMTVMVDVLQDLASAEFVNSCQVVGTMAPTTQVRLVASTATAFRIYDMFPFKR